jgi:hypothetical protein
MFADERSDFASTSRANDVIAEEEVLDEGIGLQAVHQVPDVGWADDHFAEIEALVFVDYATRELKGRNLVVRLSDLVSWK